MTKVIFVAILAILFFTAAGFFIRYYQNFPEEDIFLVGYIGPLSGDASIYGYNVQKSLELAKKELGANNFEIISIDSKCQAEAAKVAMQQLVDQGVKVVIGELCSGATLAALEVAEKNEVILISPGSTSAELNSASRYFFRTVPSDDMQSKYISSIMFDSGIKKIVVVYSDEPYGTGFVKTLKTELENLGGEIVDSLAVNAEAIYLEDEINNLLANKPEAFFLVINSPSVSAAVIKTIRSNNENMKIYGSEGLKSQSIINDTSGVAEGLIVSALTESNEYFYQNFLAEYGVEPGPFNLQAYDAFHAVYKSVLAGNRDTDSMIEYLQNIEFMGLSGNIDFLEDGSVPANYELYEVKDGKFTKIDKL